MNARPYTIWLLGSLLALAGVGCQSNEPEPAVRLSTNVQVSYAQTQCADKWGFTRDNKQLETMATAYLAQQGITFTNAQASQVYTGGVCAACTCPTGVELVGTVPTSQLAAIEALGFKK